ncbi:MAG: FAD-dependent oxidoreductase [Acidimicrobiales bacterium]
MVIGAGLAGLAAAVELDRRGHDVEVLEAADRVGGRVTTDTVDGHLLDRGFQVVLSAYPELDLLERDRLDIRPFRPGALIRVDGSFHRVADPFRRPWEALDSLRAPIGSPADKARILALRRSVRSGSLDDLWTRPDQPAIDRLRDLGFSPRIIERFFRPLFGGITLDPGLQGSSRMFEVVFRMLAEGPAGLPVGGMRAIPEQLATRLGDRIRLGHPVAEVSAGRVTVDGHGRIGADAVIVATDATTAHRLTGSRDHGWRGSTTVWVRAGSTPVAAPILVLNGDPTGPVVSVAVPSQVSATYAPAGAVTIAVAAPAVEPGLPAAMRATVRDWWGPEVDDWEELRVDSIARAHPVIPLGTPHDQPVLVDEGVWVCGDHRRDASVNGALASGRAVAAAVDARLT